MSEHRWPNVVAMLLDQAERLGDAPFLWAKRDDDWRPLSWRQVSETAMGLAAGLRAAGIGRGERVALVAENRPEWLIADIAIMAAGAITVPAYTTNTSDDHRHILGNSGAAAAIVSSQRLLDRLQPAAADASLRFIVAMDAAARDGPPPVRTWDAMLAEGQGDAAAIPDEARAIPRDATACIIYTSGTGGAPKGVMQAHAALLHNCEGAFAALEGLELDNPIFLSFLPLSHSYEHTAGQFVPVRFGAQIYYAESVEALARNMTEVRPTIMTAVPRLYETLHQRITRNVERAKPLQQRLFHRAVSLGRKRYEQGGRLGLLDRLQDRAVDRLVRDKVRAQFGGRLTAMVSGGGPLNRDVGLFLTALGVQILQGYGQTESGPVVSVNRPGRAKIDTVGPPLRETEVKIAEDGEILVRGDLVMQGYWGSDDETALALRDGWLHTGDIGAFDADGHLVITDRKKDIIVLSGGDNVSPTRIEGLLGLEPEVSQAMVVGDKRAHLVALIVPEAEWLRRWARDNGKPGNLAELDGDTDLNHALGEAVDRVNRKLSGIERVRRIAVAREPFSLDNDQLTPTLKIRRHVVREAYGEVIESLYR